MMRSKITEARIPPVMTTVPAVIRIALHQHPAERRPRIRQHAGFQSVMLRVCVCVCVCVGGGGVYEPKMKAKALMNENQKEGRDKMMDGNVRGGCMSMKRG